MQRVSAVAIFCEDIREEKSGQDVLVGTLPDNLIPSPAHLPASQKGRTVALPKFSLYLRINIDAGYRLKTIRAKLLNVDDSTIAESGWEQAVIEKAYSDAATNGMPLVGFILKVVAGTLLVPYSGKIKAIVNVDGSEILAGAIYVTAAT